MTAAERLITAVERMPDLYARLRTLLEWTALCAFVCIEAGAMKDIRRLRGDAVRAPRQTGNK